MINQSKGRRENACISRKLENACIHTYGGLFGLELSRIGCPHYDSIRLERCNRIHLSLSSKQDCDDMYGYIKQFKNEWLKEYFPQQTSIRCQLVPRWMQPQQSIVGQDFVCLSFAYCSVLFRESAVETPARIQIIIALQDKNTRGIPQQLLVKTNTNILLRCGCTHTVVLQSTPGVMWSGTGRNA